MARRWHEIIEDPPPRRTPPTSHREPWTSTADKVSAAEARLRGVKAGADAWVMDQAEARAG